MFRSIKLGILIVLAVLKRQQKWLGVGLILALALVFFQIKFHLFYSPNSLRQGLVGTYQEHDLPLEVTRLVSSGLVEADRDGRIKSKLVSGWEVNNDATVFKFKLKPGLRFSNNSEIKSSDLEFNIPDTEISFPDEHTIQFKLKESYSPLPSLLTKPIFKKGTLIGIGPYKIQKIEKSRIFITKITLVPQEKNLPKMSIRFYPNEQVAKIGFSRGEVQALLGISQPSIGNLLKLKQKTDFSKIVTILYHTRDELLSNRSLRQALSFSAPKIDEEDLADNPYPPSWWAYDANAKKYLASQEEAQAALERAKSNMSSDKLGEELILTATPNLEEVGKKVVAAWKSLNLNIKLRIESGVPQNFQILLITQTIPFDPDQYFLWHSSQEKTNLTKYSQARVDKDLEDGRKALTEDDRKTNYYDFQKTLLEDAPATFLYFPKYNILYLKKVESLLDKVLNLQLP